MGCVGLTIRKQVRTPQKGLEHLRDHLNTRGLFYGVVPLRWSQIHMVSEKKSDVHLGRGVRTQGVYLLLSNPMTPRLLLIASNEATPSVLTGPSTSLLPSAAIYSRCQGSIVSRPVVCKTPEGKATCYRIPLFGISDTP